MTTCSSPSEKNQAVSLSDLERDMLLVGSDYIILPFLNFWQSFCIPYIKITWEFYSLFRLVIKYKQIRWVTTKSYFRQNIIHSCLEGSHTVANLGSLLKQWYQQFTNKVHINKYAHEMNAHECRKRKDRNESSTVFDTQLLCTFYVCSRVEHRSRFKV